MTNQPQVSILMSSYNHSDYLEEVVRSIYAQTYKNFELLIIDDNSPDNSKVILEKLSEEFGFGLTLNSKNLGLTKNLNLLISKAKGKYITTCSSDDIWLPERLKKQVEFMENNSQIVASSSNYRFIDGQGTITGESKLNYTELNFHDVFVKGKRIPAPGAILVKEIVKKVGGYDEDNAIEDAVMWLKLTEAGHKIAIIPDILFLYRRHSTNISKNHSLMRENQLKYYEKYRNHELYDEALNKYYEREFIYLVKRNKKKALKTFKEIDLKMNNIHILKYTLFLFVPSFFLKHKYGKL